MVCQFGDITNSGSLGSAKDSFSSVKTLRNLRYVKYAGLAGLLLALIFIILTNIKQSYVSQLTDSVGAEPGISTLAASGAAEVGISKPADVNLPAITSGGIVTGGHTVTVSSTSIMGYNVAMQSDGALKDADFAGGEQTNNNLIQSTTGGTLTEPASLSDNSWGIAIIGNTGFDSEATYQSTDQSVLSRAKFAPIPGRSGDNPNGQVIFSGNTATTGDSRTIYYGARTEPYYRAGNYSTTVTYTVTAVLPDEPSILSVAPNSYELDSGAGGQITINGTNLLSAYSVYITNANGDRVGECANLNVTDDSNISCVIPTTGIPAGDYTIHAVTQGGGASVPFAYTEKPKPVNAVCTNADPASSCQVDIDANMIPITYTGDENNPEWTSLTTDEINNDRGSWYNYWDKKWANAITLKSDVDVSKYKNKHTVIDENDVMGYWVYIPRYSYNVMRRDFDDKAISTEEAIEMGGFDIRFEKAGYGNKTPVKCSYSYSSQRYQDCVASDRGESALEYPGNSASSSTTWATHPAFHWGSQELNGFWFAKYESSGTASETTVLPLQVTYSIYNTDIIGIYYDLAKGVGIRDTSNNYGNGTTGITQNSHHLGSAKSHLTKNSEWAAMMYLTASRYGAGIGGVQFNNGVDGDPDDFYADYQVTGCGQGSNGEYDCTIDKTRQWYGSVGQLASTTNNVYGIYDANGGEREAVAASYTTSTMQSSNNHFATPARSPYVDLFPSSVFYGNTQYYYFSKCTWESCGGQAFHEIYLDNDDYWSTYTGFWGGDHSETPYKGKEWVLRGGGDAYYRGMFVSCVFSGTGGGQNETFRITLLTQ